LVEPALAQLTHGLRLLSRTRYQVFHPILMSEQLRLSRLAGRPAAECSACLASPHMRLDNEHWGIAEVLRIRGEIALLPNGDGPEAAETLFVRAIGWARQQNANLWETRAVRSLARLLATQQRADEARVLLGTIGDSLPSAHGKVVRIGRARLRTHHKAAAKFGDGPFFPCCTSWHFYLPGE
jgi:hypothetical protein